MLDTLIWKDATPAEAADRIAALERELTDLKSELSQWSAVNVATGSSQVGAS